MTMNLQDHVILARPSSGGTALKEWYPHAAVVEALFQTGVLRGVVQTTPPTFVVGVVDFWFNPSDATQSPGGSLAAWDAVSNGWSYCTNPFVRPRSIIQRTDFLTLTAANVQGATTFWLAFPIPYDCTITKITAYSTVSANTATMLSGAVWNNFTAGPGSVSARPYVDTNIAVTAGQEISISIDRATTLFIPNLTIVRKV